MDSDQGIRLNPSNRSLPESFYRWLFDDYAPLDGRLRAGVYGLLLYYALKGAVFDAPTLLKDLPETLYQPPGIMGWLATRGLSQLVLTDLLAFLKGPLVIFWIMSIVGFGGRWPLRLTGCMAFLFYGGQQGCVGTGHGWHLPVAMLLICGWLIRSDGWSLDAFIARRWPAWPFNPARFAGTADLSPFARKLVLIIAVYTLFAAGVTKWVQGGWRWMDGVSLNHYLEWHNNPSTAVGGWLLHWLLDHPGIVTVLSVSTFVLELGAVVVLFWPRLRFPFFLAACGFHLGIYLVMYPRFFEQMTVYLILVPWDAFAHAHGMERVKVLFGLHRPAPRAIPLIPEPRVRRGLVVLTFCVVGMLGWTIVRQREWFPLTHIPMYSTYLSDQHVGMIPRTEFDSLEGLRRVAHSGSNHDLPWWTRYEIARHLSFQALSADGKVSRLEPPFPGMRLHRLNWAQRVSFALLNDLRRIALVDAISTSELENTQITIDATVERIRAGQAKSPFIGFQLVFESTSQAPIVLVTASQNDLERGGANLGNR